MYSFLLVALLASGANAAFEAGKTPTYYKDPYNADVGTVGWYDQDQITNLLMPIATKCFMDDDKLTELTGKAMSGDEGVMDVPEMFFDILEDYCNEEQTAQFEDALKNFKSCSGIDLKKYQETIGDALIGTFMTCGRYAYTIFNNILMSESGEVSYPLPRVPDQCVDSLVGHNPMGDSIREALEYPGAEAKCMAKLSEQLPQCTLKLWPIPLPGTIMKVTSCINSEFVPEQRELCDQQLDILDKCLPDDDAVLFDGKPTHSQQCGKWIETCAAEMSTFITSPSPFNAMPLSDICQEQAENYHPEALKKFNAFQESCVSKKDIDFWLKGTGSHTLTSYNKSSKSKSGGKSWPFFVGFLSAAAIFAAALYARSKMTGGNYFDVSNNDLTLQRSTNQEYELS